MSKVEDILSDSNINWTGADIIARLDAAGFVIVPRRLTAAMIIAGCDQIENDGTGFTEAWAAAIAAAPK